MRLLWVVFPITRSTEQDIYFKNSLNTNINLTWKVEVVSNNSYEIFTVDNLKDFYLAEGIILSLILLIYMIHKLWRK